MARAQIAYTAGMPDRRPRIYRPLLIQTVDTGFGPLAIAVVFGTPRFIALTILAGIGLVFWPLIVAEGIALSPSISQSFVTFQAVCREGRITSSTSTVRAVCRLSIRTLA